MAAKTNHWRGIHGILTPEIVYQYANQGLTMTEISKLYGCTMANISHAIESQDELKQAWEQGHAQLLVEYTGHLKKRAFENDTMLMFALKTQCGYCEEQYKVGKQLETIEQPKVRVYVPWNSRDPLPKDAISFSDSNLTGETEQPEAEQSEAEPC